MKSKDIQEKKYPRPPIIAVLGHVDHGKSTLLDKIRKTNTTESEVGGITQRLSGYEIRYGSKEKGDERSITFLDTPGHEAFASIRERGTRVADIVILVVSAEDGVMPQTKEVIGYLQSSKTPFMVAINKIDSPGANIQRTIQSLAENEVYLESMHGDVPSVSISAKSGEGIPELLNMILLMAEMEELTGDPEKSAEGYVTESTRDPKMGNTSMLIIKNGTLKVGDFVVAENAYSPVRQIYLYDGTPTKEASFSSPVNITGWNIPPMVGSIFHVVKTKKEAEKYIKDSVLPLEDASGTQETSDDADKRIIPIVLKADNAGSVEAIQKELEKISKKNSDVSFSFLTAEAGHISENDIQTAGVDKKTLVVGFNTTIHDSAARAAENQGVVPKFFTIIYELTEWMEKHIAETRELVDVEKEHGRLKILKYFSSSKKGSVLGGKVKSGIISKNDRVKIIRGEEVVGQGRIKELQKLKVAEKSIKEGQECGVLLDSPVEINEGDVLSAFTIVKE